MSQKVLDVFFRHKFLVILPLVVLLLVGLAASWTRQTTDYSSTAKVWTQRTPFLSSRLGGQGSSFVTPAEHQARVIRDLMSLNSFRRTVAEKVEGVSALSGGDLMEEIGEGTHVFSSGVNVLTIRHVGEDPILSREIVNALIATYSDTFQQNVIAEADAAEAFYEERLDEAGTRLEEAKAALAEYQGTAEPDLSPDLVEGDSQMAGLLTDVQEAQTEYDSALNRLEDIAVEKDAALKGRDLSFQVMDEPQVPSSALPTPMKSLLMFPVLGLLMGVSASGLVLFGLTRLDDSIRLPAEIRRFGVPVLAVVPEMGRRRSSNWPQNFVRIVVATSRGLLG